MKICSVLGCGRAHEARGLCHRHYLVAWRAGAMPPLTRPKRPGCSVEGCDRPHKGRGFCDLHFRRWRAGRPLDAPIRPTRPKGKAAPCCVLGCGRPALAFEIGAGRCRIHHERYKRKQKNAL